MPGLALDNFKKADKQDGGHCRECQRKMVKLGVELREWKTAEAGAAEIVGETQTQSDVALAHYQFGLVWFREGLDKRKDELFTRAHDEMTKALAAVANFPGAVFADGQALAHLKQDAAAKERFEQVVNMKGADELDRQRALRYISQPELARARMAPPLCPHYLRRATCVHGRTAGKGSADGFLGDLVRALPGGLAAHARHREEISGAAAGRA